MVHRQGHDVDLTPLPGLLSPIPERRGLALLELLHTSSGVSRGELTALDACGNHVAVAVLGCGRAAMMTRRALTAGDHRVGELRISACGGSSRTVDALVPHFTAVAEVVSRRLRLKLTSRENVILSALAEGYTNAEIAQRECVSVRTVTTHVEAIFRKLGVTNRVQAARVAMDCAMVPRQRFGLLPAHGLAAS
jgi:DNA-binding CsgD family transcriptional regulator